MVGEVKGGLWRVASVIQGCIEPVAELFAARDKRLAEFIPSSAFDAVIPGAVVTQRAAPATPHSTSLSRAGACSPEARKPKRSTN